MPRSLRGEQYLRVATTIGIERVVPGSAEDWEWAHRAVVQRMVDDVRREAQAQVRKAQAEVGKAQAGAKRDVEAAQKRIEAAEAEAARLRNRLGEVLRQRKVWRDRALGQHDRGEPQERGLQLVSTGRTSTEWILPLDSAPDASEPALWSDAREALARVGAPDGAVIARIERRGPGWCARVRAE